MTLNRGTLRNNVDYLHELGMDALPKLDARVTANEYSIESINTTLANAGYLIRFDAMDPDVNTRQLTLVMNPGVVLRFGYLVHGGALMGTVELQLKDQNDVLKHTFIVPSAIPDASAVVDIAAPFAVVTGDTFSVTTVNAMGGNPPSTWVEPVVWVSLP